jgi:hypothetical protein
MGKKTFTQAVSIFFYYNFFIAFCAASLVYETVYLFQLTSKTHWFAWLVFFCTMNIYTFHYYLKSLKTEDDSRLNWYRKYKFIILLLLLTGCIAIGYLIITHFGILFSGRNIVWTLAIPLLSLAYSFPFLPGGKALRHFGWLKLPLLSFVWSFTTVLLPAFYADGIHINSSQVWVLFFDRLIFIMALCMLFNVRDYEEDKVAGIITPVVALGPQAILSRGKWLMCLLNMITAILLVRQFHFHTPFQYAAVLLPVVLLYLLFHFFKPGRSEIQFVYLHDGLMPVKALLLIFAVCPL